MAEKKQPSLIRSRAPVGPQPVLTLFLLVLSLLATVDPQIGAAWILERHAVLQGELWRIFTCHLVHFTPTHLCYNLIVLAAAGWLVEKKSRVLFLFLYMTAAIAVCMALLVQHPGMQYYGGFSGVGCGFVLYNALLLVEQPGPWQVTGWIILIALPAKVIVEFFTQGSLLPYPGELEFFTMPLSHYAGMLAALSCFVAVQLWSRIAFSNHGKLNSSSANH